MTISFQLLIMLWSRRNNKADETFLLEWEAGEGVA
jgi:hypothetical protein